MKQTIPQPKIEDGEEVTFEATTAAVKRSVHLFSALQSIHGHWPAENAGPMSCHYISQDISILYSLQNIAKKFSVTFIVI
ncbi:hypothetical protein Gogos_005212, partial [Gossypium gossypioides]|nr:hypothetical protein [Gossypium gossypioides]